MMRLPALALTLLALTPLAVAPQARAQDAAEGERLFRSRCASCHAMAAGQNRIGPSLAGVFGRAAGGVEGARYSNALREAKLTWDAETLDRYLANPRGVVPGTTMTIAVANAEQRGAIIAYLRAQGGTP